ncbi:MAG: DNA polymerase III subunit gamma/tau [Planctomycetes bacterium]|nr:DNA polymerase III subunit gamma/tau [Planctomycetota bacterium]
MSYEVLARKYRPKSFAELTGQDAVARVLRGAIEQNRLGHAFLFTGPRGVGKTSTARILAAALNCQSASGPTATPCGTCDSCRAIAAGNDVDVVEIDGASNRKIDDIRALREQVGYAPMRSRFKVYIIDEVHQLTSEAFNALLKTLEEPPPHVKFLFATTEVEKVPETIRSRCQIHEFHRIREEDIEKRLEEVAHAEGREVPREVLLAIASAARGGMRDAQTMLDQLLSMAPGAPSLEDFERMSGRSGLAAALAWLGFAQKGDTAALLRAIAESLERGRREEDLIDELTAALRELLLLRALGASTELSAVPTAQRSAWSALLSDVEKSEGDALEWIDAGLALLLRARGDLRRAGSAARLVLELALVRFARLRGLASLESIARRLEQAPAAVPTGPAAVPRAAPARSSPAAAPPRASTPPPSSAITTGEGSRGVSASARPRPQDESELFSRFLEELARRDRGLHAVASDRMAPLRWSGQELTLALGGADFTDLVLFDDPQNRRLLEESLRAVLGPQAKLLLDGGAPASSAPPSTSASAEASRAPRPGAPAPRSAAPSPERAPRAERPSDPLVERTKQLFDGEEID